MTRIYPVFNAFTASLLPRQALAGSPDTLACISERVNT